MEALSSSLFETEVAEDTLVVTPVKNLGEFDCTLLCPRLGEEVADLLKLWETTDITNVIIDFHKIDYCGSTALGFLVELRKQVSKRGGKMILCGVSDHEQEILAVTKLDTLLSICRTREESIHHVRLGSEAHGSKPVTKGN